MEMQSKTGPHGTPGHFPSPSPGAAVAPSSPVRALGIVFRGLAIVLVLIATILMGAAKQTRTLVSGNDYDAVTTSFTLKATQDSGLVYFISANAIVFALSAVSFVLTTINRSDILNSSLLLSVIDLVCIVFLYSANGNAIGLIVHAKKGDLALDVCNIFKKFCDQVTAACVLSMIAAFAYVVLLLLTIVSLHKRSQ